MTDSRSSPADRARIADHVAQTEAYVGPPRVWVEDGHVFVQAHDGSVVNMTPEIAIELGRMISNAGADSLVNKVRDDVAAPDPDEP